MSVFDSRTLLAEGDLEDAEEAARQALRISRDSGDRWVRSTALVDHPHVLLAGRRLAEAAEAVAAIDSVPAPSDTEWVVRRRTAHALLASLAGKPDEAAEQPRSVAPR